MPSQKRIQHLRSKNKLLLDKLESHSSLIKAELKYLKRTIRGTADKSPTCNETRCKNWAKRNNSLQVTEAMSSCKKSANDGASRKYTSNSRRKSRMTPTVDCKDENTGRDQEMLEAESICYPRSKEKQGVHCKQKLIHLRKGGEDGTNQNSKTICEIISSIDYSPKSTFVKRMKSKCKPCTREVYCRLSENKGSPARSLYKEKEAKRKKKPRQERCLGGTPVRKTRIYQPPSTKENPQLSFGKSMCPDCGKKIASQPTCVCENRSSENEEPSNCGRIRMRNEEGESDNLKRLKNFRERNWQDCHAEPSMGESGHCCGHQKCNSVYGINDRLFAVPLDQSCENLVHCPSCPHLNCQQSCCTNSKQVVVTIPISLLGSDTPMDVDKKKKIKGAKESIPIPKELLKKLQRPVPQNSMALRYQKGVC